MKLIAAVLIIAIVYVDAKLQPVPFLSHKVKSNYLPRDDEPKCPETGFGKYCTADCSGITFCNNGQPAGILNCAAQTGNKNPYCNKDTLTCDASPDHCEPSNIGNKCVFTGFYPDILRCKVFHECDTVGGESVLYNCDGNAVYNPKTEVCQYGIACYEFSENGLCKGKPNFLIAHPLDKKFYVFCAKESPILNKCLGSVNKTTDLYEFDTTTTNCEYICKIAGRYPNLYDKLKNSYYECTPNGITFIKSLKTCPKDYVFEVNKCIKMVPTTISSTNERDSYF